MGYTLNMPHRTRLFPDDFSKCDFSQRIGKCVEGALPCLAGGFSTLATGVAPGFKELTLSGLDDVEEGDFLRCAGQNVATLLAASALDKTSVAKVGKDLRQVVGRNCLQLAQFLDTAPLALPVSPGELSKDPGGVFDFGGEFQNKSRGILK